MTKARILADFISDGSSLADGTISVAEVSGAAPLASPTFTGTATVSGNLTVDGGTIKLDGNYPVGTGNVALGDTALDSVVSGGDYNVAIGSEAGTAVTTGIRNSLIGALAGGSLTDADYNVAIGSHSLSSDTLGSKSTAIGYTALYSQNFTSATDTYNTAVGYETGVSVTTGVNNTLIGGLAGDAITTGSQNTALGEHAAGKTTTASDNTAVGRAAMYDNTTGANNVAVGKDALYSNTTASNNTAVGYQAGYSNTTGGRLTAFGYRAGYNCTATGTIQNVFVGNEAGYSNTSGTNNTYIGGSSASQMTTGSFNTVIGAFDGNQGGLDIRTSSNNVVLSDGNGNIKFSYESNGNTTKMPDVYTNTAGNAANVVILSSGTICRSTSSLKYKRDVQDATHGLAEVLQLRPVTYRGKNAVDGDTVFGGLIAEEVHDAGLTEFVQYADDETPDALAYGNMASLCIKAIQEQQATITALTARITALEAN